MPGTEEELAPSTALFTSSILRGTSRVVLSSLFSLDSATTGLLRISSPRKFSMHPLRSLGSFGSF